MNEYKSKEELYCSWWLDELRDNGFIDYYEYECETVLLSDAFKIQHEKHLKTKTKIIEKTLLQPHVYTPDFIVYWKPKAMYIFFDNIDFDITEKCPLYNTSSWGKLRTYIEVKPEFDQNNMTREFKINQKWLLETKDIFVNLFIPERMFTNTFTPQRYMLTDKSMKPRKIEWKIKTLEEYLKEK